MRSASPGASISAALIAAVALVLGCASHPWSLTIHNAQHTGPIGVRIEVQGRPTTWILEADTISTLVAGDRAAIDDISLLDPVTCQVWDSERLPDGPAAWGTVVRGPSGEGPWELSVEADEARAIDGLASPTAGVCVD